MIAYAIILFNLFILESLLSVDNAAVLAVMVKDLPYKQRGRALKYGIFGAFAMRGLSLLFASFLVKAFLLKILGGLYLCYLAYGHFAPGNQTPEEGVDKQHNFLYRKLSKSISPFWATVVLVEIMDMAFSVDNIFAAVSMTDNIYLIIAGVFMGIVAMRFVASWFTGLMEKHPTLEGSAFIVIGLLGLKLILSGALQDMPQFADWWAVLSSHTFDLSFSAVMMIIFFVPLLMKRSTTELA